MKEATPANEAAARIIIAGYMKVRPEDQDRFVDVLRAHVPTALRKEGCLAYSFTIDILEPSVVRMSELWRDLRSLEQHLASDEFQGTLKQLAGIEFLDRRVHRFEVSGATAI